MLRGPDVKLPYWVGRRFRSSLTNRHFTEIWMATRSWGRAMDEARRLKEKYPKKCWVVQENDGKIIARHGKPA